MSWRNRAGLGLALLAALAFGVPTGCGGSSPGPACAPQSMPDCPPTPPSFATMVQPIIQTWCGTCHVAGGMESSRPYTSYAQIQKAPPISMAAQILSCQMPPADAPQLSGADEKVLLEWIACGAPNN